MSETAGPIFRPGRNCWRVETATRMAVVIDADDYFAHARAAMLKARRRIMLIGWDFDARITLGRQGEADEGPENLGEFVLWLANRNPELDIHLLRWDVGAVKTLARGSTLLTLARWLRHPRIHTRLDGHHPTGASHHQKIVTIDDALAFCGGIDMTGDRWDTREHRHADPRRKQPNGKPYKPWHDATTAIEGPMAEAVSAIARDRWRRSGGDPLEALLPQSAGASPWPDGLEAHFRDVPVAVSRSVPVMADQDAVTEIETLYLDLIARAKRFVYAESQYFASRRIAEAIARRLEEPEGPEFVLVNPLTAQGWLEPVAMDTARARLHEALKRRDRYGRFRIYHPYTSGGEPIYVHAKILIADDRILRIGSSNMNNRSMRLDTECDVTVDAGAAGDEAAAAREIAAIRDGLMAEHLGTSIEAVREAIEKAGSLIEAVETLRGDGRSLRPYEVPDLGTVEKWLADNEVLDPEGPEEMFEPFSRRGLFRRLAFRPARG
ncbi:phospholipase D-like domain-containing protein [Aureimonas leprariae]|uniref:Phospholipase D n=1 Tax=Plantimonas leprariae TaxID=2615207 RepID=A0A7V7TV92_9HYPH|nr:phospholipase D-like domain-containing protein [Aureimonas leprariae]KAB0677176.1 phospholipase [Aureimonas leprariae]